MSTEKCIKALTQVMEGGGLSPSFDKLIKGDKTSWKRFSKFNYRDGIRRYFYLLESALIATVDERDPTSEETEAMKEQFKNLSLEVSEDISPEDKKEMLEAKMVKIMIRPPMEWEHNMLQDARPDDVWVHEQLWDLQEKYYEFCKIEAALGSEPQQYTFEVGPDDGGWVFFSPIKCDKYDEHLTDDLNPILPAWLVKGGELEECTFDISEHPLWSMNCSNECLEAIKKELSELGFTERVNNYAQCV